MRYKKPSLLFFLALCGLIHSPAWADGLIRDGVGPIATGRGGTNLAHSDNGAILLDNPAGILNAPGNGLFEIGVDTVIADIEYSDADPNDADADFQPNPVPQIAYIRKSSDRRWAAGVGLFIPAGFKAEYDLFNPLWGQQKYRSLGTLIKILPGAAYRINDRLTVGATLGVGISHVEMEGPFYLQTGPLAGTPTIFDLKTTGATPTWSVGLQYELTPKTTLGAAFRSQSRFEMDGDVDADIMVPGMGILSSSFDAEKKITWPRSVGIGLKHRFNQRHRSSVDLIWYDWSDAFDHFGIRLSDPSNPVVAGLAGPTIRDRFPMDWDDSLSVRLGHEFFPNRRETYRVGYVYHSNPVPTSTLNPYTDGTLEHAISLGYSRRWEEWTFNTGYQFTFGPERNVSDSSIVGGDFDKSTFDAEAHWLMFSVLRSF